MRIANILILSLFHKDKLNDCMPTLCSGNCTSLRMVLNPRCSDFQKSLAPWCMSCCCLQHSNKIDIHVAWCNTGFFYVTGVSSLAHLGEVISDGACLFSFTCTIMWCFLNFHPFIPRLRTPNEGFTNTHLKYFVPKSADGLNEIFEYLWHHNCTYFVSVCP